MVPGADYTARSLSCLVDLFEQKKDRTPGLLEVAADYMPNRPYRNKRRKKAILKLIEAALDAAIVWEDFEWGKLRYQHPRLWLYKEGWIRTAGRSK